MSMSSLALAPSCLASGAPVVARGLVSVIPQACSTVAPKQLAELLDRRARRRRTARADDLQFQLGKVELRFVRFHPGEEVQPDRRNAEGLGARLALKQHVEAFGIELRTGEHKLRSAHRRGERQAPGVGVEQRHHGEDRIARHEAECVGRAGGEGVQHRRAVAVQHALRIAGRAGGVAERRGRILVEERPFVIGRRLRQEILVGEQPVKLRLGKLALVAKRDPAAHKRQAGRERLDERRENRVEEHIRVFRVMHDVLDLVGKEPRIDRVQNASRAGHAIIEFQMALAVPGEGRDAVAAARPERVERVRDSFGARRDFAHSSSDGSRLPRRGIRSRDPHARSRRSRRGPK